MATTGAMTGVMLASIVQREVQLLDQLNEKLLTQHRYLGQRNRTGLETVVLEIEGCVQKLQQLAEQRRQKLKAIGKENDSEGVQNGLVAELAEQGEALWRRWIAQAQQARHQNTVNGAVINAGHQAVATALAVLKGRDVKTVSYDHRARFQPLGVASSGTGCKV